MTRFEASGFQCVIRHAPLCWCGYVGVPAGHPWFGKDYDDLQSIDVHGGLTFSRDYAPENRDANDGLWWLGFDLGHYDSPNSEEYAHEEATRLAVLAAEAAGEEKP